MVKSLKEGLIVSCQALPHEPLFGSKYMGKMAIAAKEGGAVGIRANTLKDIVAIRRAIKDSLPIIGLIKKDYTDSTIYITPTIKEVKELIKSKADVIALDATSRTRPNGETLESLVKYIRDNSKCYIMADISTIEEAHNAKKLGFDYISTTLRGYTEETANLEIPDINFIKQVSDEIKECIIVAEGGIKTDDQLKQIIDSGVNHIVIGGAITRPQLITKNYVEIINSKK